LVFYVSLLITAKLLLSKTTSSAGAEGKLQVGGREPRSMSSVPATNAHIIKTARPGHHLVRNGAEIEKLKIEHANRTNRDMSLDITEVTNLSSMLNCLGTIRAATGKTVGIAAAPCLRRWNSSRCSLRLARASRCGVSGVFNGNEIARSEWDLQGVFRCTPAWPTLITGFTEAHPRTAIIG